MTAIITTNMNSLMAQYNLNKTQASLSQSIQRLSSGLRINSAKDDAAGLAISDQLTAQQAGYDQGTRNANDAVSLLQTADGAASQITSNLQRLFVLASQASNGTNNTQQRSDIQVEFGQVLTQINTIAKGTVFNGIKLLNGSATSIGIQTGPGGSDRTSITISNLSLGALSIASIKVSGTSTGNAISAMAAITNALNTVSSIRASIGAAQNLLTNTINLNQVNSNNVAAANSQIKDTDIASETANLTQQNVLYQAGIAILAQANAQPQSVLSLLR